MASELQHQEGGTPHKDHGGHSGFKNLKNTLNPRIQSADPRGENIEREDLRVTLGNQRIPVPKKSCHYD